VGEEMDSAPTPQSVDGDYIKAEKMPWVSGSTKLILLYYILDPKI
jgi:hypothetical protein